MERDNISRTSAVEENMLVPGGSLFRQHAKHPFNQNMRSPPIHLTLFEVSFKLLFAATFVLWQMFTLGWVEFSTGHGNNVRATVNYVYLMFIGHSGSNHSAFYLLEQLVQN